MSVIKSLLGVRNTTSNVLCLIETGYPEIHSMVKKRQLSFITKYMRNSSGDEPLSVVLGICRQNNTPGYRLLVETYRYVGDPVLNNIQDLKDKCTRCRPV